MNFFHEITRGNTKNIFFILLAILSAAAYLGFSSARGVVSFPLDDAWIHQVYARNIGTRGEFAFFPGQPSAGSTSPLWTMLIAVGYLLRVDYRVWTYLIGASLVGASAIVSGRLAARVTSNSLIAIYCSLFTLLEWHLAWSAVSGMEIPLFVFISLLLAERFFASERAWILGLIAGLLTLTRPEGAALGALAGLGVIAKKPTHISPLLRGVGEIASRLVHYALGFAVLLAPYLAFNLAVSGAIFPNTFYAKNAEYAILIERVPLWLRFVQVLAVPWVGAQILLLPGFLFITARLFKKRDWVALVPVTWILTLPALYALRLPVTYQHGRYEMPLVPFIVVYGVWGTAELFGRMRSFIARGVWGASIAAVLIAFWVLGATQYAADVVLIECEMTQTARWVAQNVPTDQVVAAHDIGALGYFYPHPFIDLAGLVSPEVIPFIADAPHLRDYLVARRARYAIFFPDFSDWYRILAVDGRFVPVFRTDCAVTRAAGSANMVVYEIR